MKKVAIFGTLLLAAMASASVYAAGAATDIKDTGIGNYAVTVATHNAAPYSLESEATTPVIDTACWFQLWDTSAGNIWEVNKRSDASNCEGNNGSNATTQASGLAYKIGASQHFSVNQYHSAPNRAVFASQKAFNVRVKASVAQWMKASLSNQGWYFLAGVPGRYLTDCMALNFDSNNQVNIAFTGFNSNELTPIQPIDGARTTLVYPDSGLGSKPTVKFAFKDASTNDTLAPDVVAASLVDWSNLGSTLNLGIGVDGWTTSAFKTTANAADVDEGLVTAKKKLWCQLSVNPKVAPGVYEGAGVITFTVKDLAGWVKGNTDTTTVYPGIKAVGNATL